MTKSNHPVQDLVAQADRQRRLRGASLRLRRLLPVVAGGSLAIGLIGRFLLGWPSWIGVAALVAGLLAVAAIAWFEQRTRETTDEIAAAVDTDAGLAGELRSAHWFVGREQRDRDEWADYHVNLAARRAGQVDWAGLYPRVRGMQPWVLTLLLSAGVIALAIRVPARVSAAVTASDDAGVAPELAALPKDLQAKLAALMAQLDQAAAKQDPAAKAATLADMKDLLAKLDPAQQKKLMDMLEKKALEKDTNPAADKDTRADAAENATSGLPEDAKWAKDNEAAKQAMADDKKGGEKNAAASGKAADQNGKPQAQDQGDAAAAEKGAPMMREAAAEQASKVMMSGGGPMGGDSRPGQGAGNDATKGAAEALLVAQALRKEMVEASADALGENVDKEDLRRKTEQGKSSLGFTRVAAPQVEPSRATAPPPVPEARRPLLLQYFIRR